MAVRSKQIIETGVPRLDVPLGGGIPAPQSMVVTGDPGQLTGIDRAIHARVSDGAGL